MVRHGTDRTQVTWTHSTMRWCHGVMVFTAVAAVKGLTNARVIGPYKLECNEIGNCKGDDHEEAVAHVKEHNSSESSSCSGYIHLNRGLDNHISGSYSLELLVDNSWHVLTSDNYTAGCQAAMDTLPELFSLLQLPAACPVARGTFSLHPSKMNSTLSQFPKLPFGRFRLNISALAAPDATGCVYFDMNVAPKDT